MATKKSARTTLKEALASFATATEVDDQVVNFVKGKKAKFKFFLRSGRQTAILMMAVPALLGLALGYLIRSLL